TGPASDEHHREQVGQAELRRVAVRRPVLGVEWLPQPWQWPGGGAASDLDDVLGREGVLGPKLQRAVHIWMGDGAARVGLEGEPLELPRLAECCHQGVEPRGIVAAGERRVESVLALEDPGGTGEPVAGEEGSDHGAVSAPARTPPLRPRAPAEVLEETGLVPARDAAR